MQFHSQSQFQTRNIRRFLERQRLQLPSLASSRKPFHFHSFLFDHSLFSFLAIVSFFLPAHPVSSRLCSGPIRYPIYLSIRSPSHQQTHTRPFAPTTHTRPFASAPPKKIAARFTITSLSLSYRVIDNLKVALLVNNRTAKSKNNDKKNHLKKIAICFCLKSVLVSISLFLFLSVCVCHYLYPYSVLLSLACLPTYLSLSSVVRRPSFIVPRYVMSIPFQPTITRIASLLQRMHTYLHIRYSFPLYTFSSFSSRFLLPLRFLFIHLGPLGMNPSSSLICISVLRT